MSEHRMIMAEKSVKEKNWENVLTQTENISTREEPTS